MLKPQDTNDAVSESNEVHISKHVDLISKYLCYHTQITTTTIFKEKYINLSAKPHCTERIRSLKHLTPVSAWMQVKEKNNEYHECI